MSITGGKVSEESSSIQVKAQALIIEVEQLRIIQSEAIKALKEAEQALKKELKIHQQLKLQLEKNKTVNDGLQRQIETLRMETETLLSNSSIARERGYCIHFPSFLESNLFFL